MNPLLRREVVLFQREIILLSREIVLVPECDRPLLRTVIVLSPGEK